MESFTAAEDDPSPAIEGLQIAGEAFPGNQLQACGYSINGTTSCNFEVNLYFCLLNFININFFALFHVSGYDLWKMDPLVTLKVIVFPV